MKASSAPAKRKSKSTASKLVLDAYAQEIEDHFEEYSTIENVQQMKEQLVKAAKAHVNKTKTVTLDIAARDLEAIKIKASKLGLPYKTYIDSIIHIVATKV